MKKLTLIPMLCLSLFLTAQDILPTHTIVENTLKELKAGMSLADFKEKKPSAEAIKDMDFRVTMLEKINQNGLKVIAYYFDNDGKKPFYETLIAFDNEAICKETAQKLFGAPNHPTKKEKNIWVIYKGDDDITTTAWIYKERLILYSQVPKSEMENDEMFNLPDDFKNVDLRPNSEPKKPTKNEEKPVDNEEKPAEEAENEDNGKDKLHTKFYTRWDYSQGLALMAKIPLKLKMSSDSIKTAYPEGDFQKKSTDTHTEFLLPVQKHGLKSIIFYADKDDNKALYETILEFENADTLDLLTTSAFGKSTHPTMDNHWVLDIDKDVVDGHRAVVLLWVYENRLMIACNLPETDIAENMEFNLSDKFIAEFLKAKNGDTPDKDGVNTDTLVVVNDAAVTKMLNSVITQAIDGFSAALGDAIPDKKDEYTPLTGCEYQGAKQSLIRKNAAGNWRYEARFEPHDDIDSAFTDFDAQLNSLKSLEGLEYRLVKKSEYNSSTGKTFVFDVQTQDDATTGVIIKLQVSKLSGGDFALKIEIGK
jgi:hypothetical protein